MIDLKDVILELGLHVKGSYKNERIFVNVKPKAEALNQYSYTLNLITGDATLRLSMPKGADTAPTVAFNLITESLDDIVARFIAANPNHTMPANWIQTSLNDDILPTILAPSDTLAESTPDSIALESNVDTTQDLIDTTADLFNGDNNALEGTLEPRHGVLIESTPECINVEVIEPVAESNADIDAPQHTHPATVESNDVSPPWCDNTPLFAVGVGGAGGFNKEARFCQQLASWNNLIDFIESPHASTAKLDAPYFLCSNAKTRKHNNLPDDAQYDIIKSDIDFHIPLESLYKFIAPINCKTAIYSTYSATNECQKWRVVIKLDEPVDVETFVLLSAILNDKLEAASIVPDRSSERPLQISFVPNHNGVFYETGLRYANAPPLEWSTVWANELADKRDEKIKLDAEKAHRLEQSRIKAAEMVATGGMLPRSAFLLAYSIESCLDAYGYVKHGSKWLSPYSTSGVAGVTLWRDGQKWHSRHESDVDAGIGAIGSDGQAFGDAFDLYTHFVHGNNVDAAVIAAGEMFTTDSGMTINKSNRTRYAKELDAKVDYSDINEWIKNVSTLATLGCTTTPTSKHTPSKPPRSTSARERMARAKQRKESNWLVRHMIACKDLGVVFGDSGAGKSWWVLDLSVCVSSGIKFHGEKVLKKNVYYVAGEGNYGIDDRLLGFYDHYEKDYEMNYDGLRVTEWAAAFMDSSSTLEIANDIQSFENEQGEVGLIIVDTLHRNMGNGNENSAQDIGIVLSELGKLSAKFNAAVLLVHHSGLSEKDRVRGSSSLYAACDFEYKVESKNNILTVSNTKIKSIEPQPPRHYQFKKVMLDAFDIDVDDDTGVETSTQRTSLILIPTNDAGVGCVPKITDRDSAILEHIKIAFDKHGISPEQPIPDWLGNQPARVLAVPDLRTFIHNAEGATDKRAKDSISTAIRRAIPNLTREKLMNFSGDYVWLECVN